jgi:hypothetical protein
LICSQTAVAAPCGRFEALQRKTPRIDAARAGRWREPATPPSTNPKFNDGFS